MNELIYEASLHDFWYIIETEYIYYVFMSKQNFDVLLTFFFTQFV